MEHNHTNKNIFFMRHAESDANVNKVFSPPDTPLSEKGVEQTHLVMRSCTTVPFEVVIASDYVRTQQTARHINEETHKPIVTTELLRERKFPKELIGKERESGESKKILQLLHEHASDADWHYSDEENFSEFKQRGRAIFEFLANRDEKDILVVTHSITMKMIVSLVLGGMDSTPTAYEQITSALATKNTGITYVRYESGKWKLITWNNFSHLNQFEF